MQPKTPAALVQSYVARVQQRELEALLSLYEPDALFVPKPHVHVRGHAALREGFEELFAIEPVLTVHIAEEHQATDLVLLANDWTLEGTTPDGRAVARSGRSAVVLRRGDDGSWRIVMDRL
ncbi:MAG: SgcJ/EcaC family oxidoreductase [Myxococcales bacterium]